MIRLLFTAIALIASMSTANAIPTDYLYSFGSQGAGDGQFSGPSRVAIGPSGAVYVLDSGNQRIEKFDADGNFLTKWNNGRPFTGSLYGITVAPDGLVYAVQAGAMQVFDANGNYLYFFNIPLASTSDIDVTTGPGGTICIARTQSSLTTNFLKYLPNGNPVGPNGGLMFIAVAAAAGFQIDADGDVFYHSNQDGQFPNQILKRTSAGVLIAQWASQANNLGFDAAGNVYATDPFAKQVHIYDNDGGLLGEFGTAGTAPGQFNYPRDVAVAADGRIYVVDQANHRVDVFGAGPVPTRPATWGRIKADYR